MRFDPVITVISYFTALCYIHTNNQKLSINILKTLYHLAHHRSREPKKPPWLWSNLWGKNGSPMWRSCDSRFCKKRRSVTGRLHGCHQIHCITIFPIFQPPRQSRVFPGRWSSLFRNFQASHFSYTPRSSGMKSHGIRFEIACHLTAFFIGS